MSDDAARAPMPKLSRFEVLRRIGEGASGVVMEAIDRDRGERVALKALRAESRATLLSLKQEFRALQDIQHPNLVSLGELLCDNGLWFFTMELVEGPDFLTYVNGPAEPAQQGSASKGSRPRHSYRPASQDVARFDEARLRASLRQLAEGLGALHAASRVHRDIKPSNVLVAPGGRVVILDFGLVVDTSETSGGPEDGIAGTVAYMAPEQVTAEAIGPAADLYATGCMLYECLCGRPPFEGGAHEVLELKLLEDPVPPSALVRGVPPDLDASCLALLDRDPLQRPTAQELIERLDSRAAPSTPQKQSGATRIPFVGRASELAALERALDDVRGGAQVTIVVEGESGVGKSALVRQFTKGLGRDTRVFSGRCYEREAVPYKAVDGVVDAFARYLEQDGAGLNLPAAHTTLLARAFPVLKELSDGAPVSAAATSTASREEARERSREELFEAFRSMIGAIAGRTTLVVVIDDLQWADPDSLALLVELLRAPAPRFLLVATARSLAAAGASEPEDRRAPFGLPGDVRRVSVRRLSAEEGLELATKLLERSGELGARLAREIAVEADGHPLFVDELVRHAQLEGLTTRGHALLDEALFARIQRLEPSARRILEIVSVGGVALRQETVTRAAELSPADFARAVNVLRVAHLARTSGVRAEDAIEAYHDRVREAVFTRLDEATRTACHARIAAALEARDDTDPEALALHWLGGGELALAGQYSLLAADRALHAFAFEHAARLYARALENAPLSPEQRQSVLVRMASALGNAGLGDEAADAYLEAAARASAGEALDLRRRASEELLIAGRLDEGERILRDVLASAHLRMPTSAIDILVSFLCARVWLFFRGMRARERAETEIPSTELVRFDTCCGVARALTFIETIRGAYFSTRALLLALDLGEPRRLSFALSFESAYLTVVKSRRRRLAPAVNTRASALAARVADPTAMAMAQGSLAFNHFISGRFADGVASGDAAVAFVRERCPGAFWELRTYQMTAIWSLAWMGELHELSERVERASREAERRGDLAALTMLRAGQPNLGALRGGDSIRARSLVVEAAQHWTQRGYHNQHYWRLLALTQVDLYEGRGSAAHARVRTEWAGVRRGLILEVPLMRVEALYLRARADIAAARDARDSEKKRLLRAATRDARRIASARELYAPGLASLAYAGIAFVRADAALAVHCLRNAVSQLDSVSMRLHANAARLFLGELLAGADGSALGAGAMAWFHAQRVADPRSMARVVVSGFG